MFYFTASNTFNRISVSYPLWSIITVIENYSTASGSRLRCRFICPSVNILLTYNIPHIFKLISFAFVFFYRFKWFNRIRVSYPLWSIRTVKEYDIIISGNRLRCRLICPSVYVLMTYHIPHIFKLTSSSFVLVYSFK